MPKSPKYKVYDRANVYIAACKDPADAAAILAIRGAGYTIRDGHPRKATLWTEGEDGNTGFETVGVTVLRVYEKECARAGAGAGAREAEEEAEADDENTPTHLPDALPVDAPE